MNKLRLTKTRKLLAGASVPYALDTGGGPPTRRQVYEAKLAACGRYWNETETDNFVAFTKDGEREFFSYARRDRKDIRECEEAARLWSLGRTQDAYNLRAWSEDDDS